MDSSNIRIVNIYAQSDINAESIIMGSKTGLEALKKALEMTLENGESGCRVATSDLETYGIKILINNELLDSPFWTRMKLPYGELDDCCKETESPHIYLEYGVRNSEDLLRAEPIMKGYRESVGKDAHLNLVGN